MFVVNNNIIEVNLCNTQICIDLCNYIKKHIEKTRSFTIRIKTSSSYLSLIACISDLMEENNSYFIRIETPDSLQLTNIPSNIQIINTSDSKK